MNRFFVVELKPGGMDPVLEDGKPMVFTSGKEAANYATRRSSDGKKFQPRPITDDKWREREEARMKAGDYKPLPWEKQLWWRELKPIWKDHFPHAAIIKGAHVAFTESDEKGAADIQTPIRPGKYLERYFGAILNQYVIRDLCSQFSAKYEDNQLLIAEDADDMVEVYIDGPGSCMSKPVEDYPNAKGVHPVRMYAAGDLKLAYLKREGRVVARTIIWPEKKLFNLIYGDRGRLEPLLKAEGYKQGAPHGARLLKHKIARGDGKTGEFAYLGPHVDNIDNVHVVGDFLVLGKGKSGGVSDDIILSGAAGHSEWLGHKCAHCGGNEFAARHLRRTYTNAEDTVNQMWCNKCAEKECFTDRFSGYPVVKDAAIPLHDGSLIWAMMAKDHTFVCEATGERHINSDLCKLADGTKWSIQHFRKQGKYCSCGMAHPKANMCDEKTCKKGATSQFMNVTLGETYASTTGSSTYRSR